jgi:hypothetical protein
MCRYIESPSRTSNGIMVLSARDFYVSRSHLLEKIQNEKKPSSTSKTFSCRNHLAWLTGERGVNWLTTILYVEQIALSVVIEMGRDFMMDG